MSVSLKGISTITLDIEGTLCPIWFVARVLYPYATAHLETTVIAQWDAPSFQHYKEAFPSDVRSSPDAVVEHCRDLAARDIKDPAWKKLQGLIWRTGYADGELAVPLFAEVVARLREWRGKGYGLVIFSSGSVEAQKLFFGYVDGNADLDAKVEGDQQGNKEDGGEDVTVDAKAGEKRKADEIVEDEDEPAKKTKVEADATASSSTAPKKVETEDLNDLFDANYDTVNAGPKIVAESYTKIVKELGKEAGECLFLSDNVKEVAAAKEAGLHAIVVDRPGNAPLSNEDRERFDVIESLDQVKLDRSS